MLTRLTTFVAFVTVTALLLGMLGRFFWPLDLLAHFRVHYVVALVLCGVMLLVLKDWRSSVFALLAAALAAVPTFDYVHPAAMARSSRNALRVLSLNVWFRNEDPGRLAPYLESSGADVIVLQEISQGQARDLRARLKSYPHAYVEGAALTDVVLFARWPLREPGTVKLSSTGVSALRAIVDWRGMPITVVGAHLHWPIGPRNSARRNGELVGLAELARTHTGPLLLLGDFNITPWSAHFSKFLDTSRLKDCAAGHGLDPTWPSQVWPLGIRIDHCFASAHWLALNAWTGPRVGSDHRPMIAELVPR